MLYISQDSLPTPPIDDLSQLDEWWTAHGTALAALSIARVAGLALCCYLTVIGLLAMLAALTRWRWLATLTKWVTTPALRRLLIGGSLAISLSAQPASASTTAFFVADTRPPSAEAAYTGFTATDIGPATPTATAYTSFAATDIRPTATTYTDFTATDIGPAATTHTNPTTPDFTASDIGPAATTHTDPTYTDFTATDIGPAATTHTNPTTPDIGSAQTTADAAEETTPSGGLPANADAHAEQELAEQELEAISQLSHSQTWSENTRLVMPGDTLWDIAADTVASRRDSADSRSVVQYWLDLIEANSDVLGNDPDVIYPGQIINLPD